MARYLCAVDVGTSSVRVGVMDDLGHLFSSAEHPIIMNRPSADQAEYDSEDTWSATSGRGSVARTIAPIEPAAPMAAGIPGITSNGMPRSCRNSAS